ncbi:MAG: hypothetical protein ACLFQ6_01880 [Candidatus Sumerlaeia bacterium]
MNLCKFIDWLRGRRSVEEGPTCLDDSCFGPIEYDAELQTWETDLPIWADNKCGTQIQTIYIYAGTQGPSGRQRESFETFINDFDAQEKTFTRFIRAHMAEHGYSENEADAACEAVSRAINLEVEKDQGKQANKICLSFRLFENGEYDMECFITFEKSDQSYLPKDMDFVG